jgi:cysteine sulfinate desulfinase/cysteine desulfurase-like protein/anaerobic selenocysteine-containing dehydrogenase
MDDGRYRRKGICGLCPAGCWIEAVYDEAGRIARVLPDTSSELGVTCKLAEHASEIIYSPNRILNPLLRKGPKGTLDFEEIPWDRAYDLMVTHLNRIKAESGPQAAAVYTGVGTFEPSFCDIYQPAGVATSSASSVLFPYGSPNTMGVGALCYVAYGMMAPHLTTGRMIMDMFNDVEKSELVVVWGANPATDLPPVNLEKILEARRRGARVVVIDPRRTATARLTEADWVPIRPGTDGALALGLCNVLLEEELHDEGFARNWTTGFEPFTRYVQHYRAETVEGITGVPAERIRSLARELAAARGASQYMYTGLEYSNSGVQAIRATIVLWALAGQLDVPGGRCLTMRGNNFPINRGRLVPSPGGVKLGADRFPLYEHYRDEAHAIALPEAVLQGRPYPVRSLIVQGASMLTSWPNPPLWRKTFEALELMVCIDRHLTADCAYADLVLPAATYFEIDSYAVYGPFFRMREKMMEPLGEAKGDVSIMAELARRLGYGHLYPQDPEELYARVLEGSGFTPEDVRRAGGVVSTDTEIMQYKKWEKGLLRDDGQTGFDTPSGKLEIHSSVLEDFGYDPLPVYTEPAEGPRSRPDLGGRFPLVFNSGARVRTSFHTQHQGVPGLIEGRPEPAVMVNEGDARDRDIRSGDLVRISTGRGSLTMRALVTPDIAPGCIEANHGCGSPVGLPAWRERNVNELTDLENHDPISGFPVYKCLLCQVEKEESSCGRVVVDSSEISERELNAPPEARPRPEIYLDHNGTTPLAPAVQEAVAAFMAHYGNPSSIYRIGVNARSAVEDARRKIASSIHCTARRVIFTGSGSEANNLAIKGVAFQHWDQEPHFVTSLIEHPSVLGSYAWLERMGFRVTRLRPDRRGLIDPDDFRNALTDKTVLASIMLANNETGAVQPVSELTRLARERGCLLHCDAVQGLGKIPLDVEALQVDLLSLSAHKIYGPKGVGALYVRKGLEPEALISGGGQERGLRSGTENILGIVGFGAAVEDLPSLLDAMAHVEALRTALEGRLFDLFEGAFVNGPAGNGLRLPNTASITVPGVRGESLVTELGQRGVYFSSGSACHAGSPEPSAALLAMGLSQEEAHCTIRISLGVNSTEEQIGEAVRAFRDVIDHSKKVVRFAPCR